MQTNTSYIKNSKPKRNTNEQDVQRKNKNNKPMRDSSRRSQWEAI